MVRLDGPDRDAAGKLDGMDTHRRGFFATAAAFAAARFAQDGEPDVPEEDVPEPEEQLSPVECIYQRNLAISRLVHGRPRLWRWANS